MPPSSVLIAMTAFKGSLSNSEACAAVSDALNELKIPNQKLPVGDGGSGSLTTVESIFKGERCRFPCHSSYGESVEATILCYPNIHSPKWIYIESSQVCGWATPSPAKRDALRATSRGLGQLLKQTLERFGSFKPHLYIGLGDSAISDAGIGMLSELGFVFTDAGNSPLWGSAENLRQIRSFKRPAQSIFEKYSFTVLCDVVNPLCGPDGSARTFSPQKGATTGQVGIIEEGMENFASLVEKDTGKKIRLLPMLGSAGGLAAAFHSFFPCRLVQGARFLLDWIGFDSILETHDWLITGEGRTDRQTLSGKAPKECYDRALRLGKKIAIVSGSLGSGYETILNHPNVVGCFACGDKPSPAVALKGTAFLCGEKITQSQTDCTEKILQT